MGLLRRPYEVLQHKKEGGSINREYQRYGRRLYLYTILFVAYPHQVLTAIKSRYI